MQLPPFWDPDSNKEITLACSRRYLAKKIKEAGLSPQHIRGQSRGIGGATAYANSPNGGATTAAFLGLWESGAGWIYMHAYRRPLEMAGVAVERESGDTLVRLGPVSKYAQGSAPN